MTTLTINREKLVKALADLEHVSGDSRLTPWLVAVPFDIEGDREARVIWADTPSNLGGYFANMQGEKNFDPCLFLDQDGGNVYTWGEQGTGGGGEWTEDDTENAMDWIDTNLVDVVDLDGQRFSVKYE